MYGGGGGGYHGAWNLTKVKAFAISLAKVALVRILSPSTGEMTSGGLTPA